MNPFISRSIIYPLQERLLKRPTFSYLREIEQSQWLSRSEIEEIQSKKLQVLLAIAKEHCPWHSRRILESGIDIGKSTIADLGKLPVTSKADVQAHGDEMTWRGVPGGIFRYTTGGSSGQPLIFNYGRNRQASDAAGRIRARKWWGVNVGDPEIYLWGAPVELNKTDRVKTIRDRMLNQLVLNAFQMSPEAMDNYLVAINKFNPACIYGYASSLALLARYSRETGRLPYLRNLKVVCTTGEPLYPEQRAVISEVFGAPVANEFGSRDVGFTAHENRHQQMLQMSESVIIEVLDRKGELSKPGEMGEAVITGLCSHAQPFIRYRTGDMVRISTEPDKDGRGLHVLDEVVGRSTDFLVHKNGSIVHALAAIYILRETPGIEQFKIIQHEIDQFEILIMVNEGWSNDGLDVIAEKFKARFGKEADVAISLVDEIAPEASGKTRQVVSKLQPVF